MLAPSWMRSSKHAYSQTVALCCVVLCCAECGVVCCAVLCCAVLCCVVLRCVALYGVVLCCAMLCWMWFCVLCYFELCCVMMCCVVLCCAVLCWVLLCCVALFCIVLCCVLAFCCINVTKLARSLPVTLLEYPSSYWLVYQGSSWVIDSLWVPTQVLCLTPVKSLITSFLSIISSLQFRSAPFLSCQHSLVKRLRRVKNKRSAIRKQKVSFITQNFIDFFIILSLIVFWTCLTVLFCFVFFPFSFFVAVVIYSDVDECTASSPVCDVNATCQNTRGSYYCTCKIGYSGDGKTCKGWWGTCSLHSSRSIVRLPRTAQLLFCAHFMMAVCKTFLYRERKLMHV